MSSASPLPPARLRDLDLVEMWKSLLLGEWNSLAIVPTDHGISVDDVVEVLVRQAAGAIPTVRVVDGRGADLADAKMLAQEVSSIVRGGTRAVVVTDSLMRSLAGVHLVQAVNGVLLVLRLGEMDVDALASTVAAVGHERILGSITASRPA